MFVKLLTEFYLEFLSLIGGYTGSSESRLVKTPHCWKSHVILNNESNSRVRAPVLLNVLNSLRKSDKIFSKHRVSYLSRSRLINSIVLYAISSFAVILTRKSDLVALLLLSFGCLVAVRVL